MSDNNRTISLDELTYRLVQDQLALEIELGQNICRIANSLDRIATLKEQEAMATKKICSEEKWHKRMLELGADSCGACGKKLCRICNDPDTVIRMIAAGAKYCQECGQQL